MTTSFTLFFVLLSSCNIIPSSSFSYGFNTNKRTTTSRPPFSSLSSLPLLSQQKNQNRIKQQRYYMKTMLEQRDDNNDSTKEEEETQEEEEAAVVGAISSSIKDLAKVIGGTGRAQLVWDCYRIGVDPALFFGKKNNQQEQEELHGETLNKNTESTLSKFLSHLDFSKKEDNEEETKIRNFFATSRQTQSLGSNALTQLASTYDGKILEGGVASLSSLSVSRDGTTKMLIRLEADGVEVESVIIPWMERGWSTLCVSSQVGCRQGCTFCATGRMGLKRSLTSDEILAQIFFAKKIIRLFSSVPSKNNNINSQQHQQRTTQLPDVTNIVFMGMGEPTDNIQAVTTAVNILTDESLFQFSRNRVTVSTVAPTLSSFSILENVPCVLAWSVHAADDAKRQKLVPTAKHSVEELKQGLIRTLLNRPKNLRDVMLEVALIHNVNDSHEDAVRMADLACGIMDAVSNMKLMVNLIPFNDIGHASYCKPTEESVKAYQKVLWDRNIYAHVRETRGDDESAACGQLATMKRRKEQREVAL